MSNNPAPDPPLSIPTAPFIIRRRTIVAVLLACTLILSALSLAGQISTYVFDRPFLMGAVPLFYVDLEANVPTWYQSTVFMFGAVLLFTIGLHQRRNRQPFGLHWVMLSILFVFLSIDEAAQMHEYTMEPMTRFFGKFKGAWRPMWVMLGLGAVTLISIIYIHFFLHLELRERVQVALAGILFVGGAIGVEMATAAMFEVYHLTMKLSLRYVVMTHIEELFEMLGLLVFIDFLLARLKRLSAVTVKVD